MGSSFCGLDETDVDPKVMDEATFGNKDFEGSDFYTERDKCP